MAGKRKLTARQIRWLFATGRLRASGRGKDRKVTYDKNAGAPKRTVIGGSKAAGLRGGAGGRAKAVKRGSGIRPVVTERIPGSTRGARTDRVDAGYRAATRKYQRDVLGMPDRPLTGGGGTFSVKRLAGGRTAPKPKRRKAKTTTRV